MNTELGNFFEDFLTLMVYYAINKTTDLTFEAMKNSLVDTPSSAEARGKRIRFIRDHLLSLTRVEFCENIDITLPALKGWELAWGGGLTPQGAEKFVKRAKQLNVYCSEAWLMHGIGREAVYITKDLDIQESDENHIAKELLLFRELENSLDAVCKDDGMIPIIYPHNYVGGVICQNIDNAVGKECILVDDNNDIYIRILKHGDTPGFYNLCCHNPHATLAKQEIKNISIKIAAPIIWIRKLYREPGV